MDPHPRNDNPPRRNPESHGEGEAAPSPEEQDPNAYPPEEVTEQPYEEVNYDPGQALVEDNQQYQQPEVPAPPPPPAINPNAGVYDSQPQPQQPVTPQNRPIVRKKVASRAPGRKTPSTRGRSSYKRPKPSYNSGGGGVMTVFMTLIALALLGAVVYIILPKDLSKVQGYPVNPVTSGEPRNLLKEAQAVMIDRKGEIAFSEEEVNRYLNHRLQGQQNGAMASLVKFRGVYVDLTPGIAEIIVERELFGMPITMSSKVRAEKFRGQVVYRSAGWSLGKFEFASRNIKPVIDMFIRLRNSCLDEFTTMQNMAEVKFEENQIVLDSVL